MLHHNGTTQLEKSLTHSHPRPTPSFQRLTLPSPQLTARMFPASDQLTRQTASGKWGSAELGEFGNKVVEVQGEDGEGRVWMSTVRSCQPSQRRFCCETSGATYLRGRGKVHARQPDVWRPGHISDPIIMPFNHLLLRPLLPFFVITPYADHVV